MYAGKLRHQVTLERYEKTGRSDSGATIYEWVSVGTVWADVEQLRGRLLFAAQEAHSKTTARIRMRYRADIAAATGKTIRISHGDQVYRIDGRPIDVGGRRSELEMMCQEWD